MRRSLISLVLVAACAQGEAASSRGRVVVDTLADGTPRTITELPVGWADTSGWKLVEVARLTGGEEGGAGEIVNPQDVTLDGAGRIYVSEQDPAVIKQFNPDGSFLRTIGHAGQGPGEFSTAFIAVGGDKLYVQDPSAQRASVFDTAGTYLRSWPSFCCYWMPIETDSAGNVLLQGMPPSTAVVDDKNPWQRTVRWYRADTTVADTSLVPTGPEEKRWTIKRGKTGVMSTTVPFQPRMQFTFLGDHRLVSGFADRYLFAVTQKNGADTVAIFGRSWTAAPVPEEVRTSTLNERITQTMKYNDEAAVRNAFQLSDIPTTAAAFDWLGRDGAGNLWIRTPNPSDSTRTTFDVFDTEFRWLGQVSGSKYLRSWSVGIVGDRVIGQGEDDEGNPIVVVYRIERGAGGQ